MITHDTMSVPGPAPFFSYWGKTDRTDTESTRFHLLAYHCLDVAAVGQRLLERDPLLRSRLASLVPLPADDLVPITTFFLALHDLGKFSDRFQGLAPHVMQRLSGRDGGRAYRTHHSTLGYALWESEVWPRFGEPVGDAIPGSLRTSRTQRRRWRYWFSAVTGHHGTPPDGDTDVDDLGNLYLREDQDVAGAFTAEMSRMFLPMGGPSIEGDAPSRTQDYAVSSWLLAGLVVLADWIGSSDDFSFHEEPMPLDEYWRTVALPTADAALDRARILPVPSSPASGLAGLMGQEMEPTPLQHFAETCPLHREPELYILEDATGSGKTEAALVLAHRLLEAGHGEGIFMGLPTMATANAMYSRFGDIYRRLFVDDGSPSLVKIHGRAHIPQAPLAGISVRPSLPGDDAPPEERSLTIACSAWIAESRKRALLAHVGVGTIDQALMAILPIRFQSLRLLGLARSILIVDEVHAYDPYVHELLCALLYFHAAFGGCAILLSATLPSRQRRELVESFRRGLGNAEATAITTQAPYPLVTRSGVARLEEVPIEMRPLCRREVGVTFVHSVDAVLRVIAETVREGGCACWIRNTVQDAMDGYRMVADLFGQERVRVFHARFADGDRFVHEANVVDCFGRGSTAAERAGQVLVATQVVEQSLDLDFDCMVSDLAPIDLLLQRAGRLYRHDRPERRGSPRLTVFSPRSDTPPDERWYSRLFPLAAYVYPKHGQLWLTASLLATKGGFRIPDDARDLIEGVYGDEAQVGIPAPLASSEIRAAGRESGDRSLALMTELSPGGGYARGLDGVWPDEERARTRLGEPTVELTLARWDGSNIRPWCDGEIGWELSRITVPARKIGTAAPLDRPLEQAVAGLQRKHRHIGRTTILIPLRYEQGGIWTADAFEPNGSPIRVLYDRRLGLRIE